MVCNPFTRSPGGGALHRLWRLHTGTPARIAVSVISLAALLWSIAFVYQYFVLPVWGDIYRWVEDFQLFSDGHFTFHDLVKPHNEHRIATTRVLLLLDSLFFEMNGRSTVIINLGILAAVGVLVWRLVGLDGIGQTPWVAPPLFWAALLCATCQHGNLDFAFQVQFALNCLAACGAVSLLTAATLAPPARAAWLAGAAGLCAVLAAFSMAAGVFVAPALIVLLLLRRAGWPIWLAFVPVIGLGLLLFFRHYGQAVSPFWELFDARVTGVRIVYIANFLGSWLNGRPVLAPYAGAGSLILFLVAAAALLSSYSGHGRKVPAGDAALLALGVFVVLCALAGTVTIRIRLGAGAALASRYATMSLLFAAVVLGLYARARARSNWPAWWATATQPLLAALCLGAANLNYAGVAGGVRTAVNSEAQLLANNIGIDGPVPASPYYAVTSVAGALGFLHAHQLNMFAPENRVPAALLARLRATDPSALEICRGAIDVAYALDDSGFLLSGWVADPQGKRTGTWIAALDGNGTVLGAARPLLPRADLPGVLGKPGHGYGFQAGFRLASGASGAAADQPRPVRVAALFSGAGRSPCVLPVPALIGPVQVTPATALGQVSAVASSVTPDGFAASREAAGAPGGGPLWRLAQAAHGSGTLRFTVTQPVAAGQAFALPFTSLDPMPAVRLSITLADGTHVEAPLAALWIHGAWQAAVVPAAMLARHGGVTGLEVAAHDNPSLVIGAPLLATPRSDWSRLF